MKLSKKTDYALRVLFTLVEHYTRGPIPIRELARRNEAPKRFLEHIMLEMKARGWVDSAPGKNGGYILAKSPNTIMMGEVVRHFDGVLAPIGCVSVTHYQPCSQSSVCRFRRFLMNIRNDIARQMDRASLACVYADLPLGPQELFEGEFIDGSGI